jgi:hypothetical protein
MAGGSTSICPSSAASRAARMERAALRAAELEAPAERSIAERRHARRTSIGSLGKPVLSGPGTTKVVAADSITPITQDDLWARVAEDMSRKPYKALGIDLLAAARRDREQSRRHLHRLSLRARDGAARQPELRTGCDETPSGTRDQ